MCEVCGARGTRHRSSLCRMARNCGEECQASRWEAHKDYGKVLVRGRELGVALYNCVGGRQGAGDALARVAGLLLM